MRKKRLKLILSMLLAVILLSTFVYGDTSIIFTTPGEEGEESALSRKIESMMDIIKGEYYKDVTDEELLDGAMKGMFEALDKHSTFFTPEEFEAFNSDIEGEFGGVGLYIEKKDERITVVSPIEDTPADRAGLRTGDILLKANDIDLTGLSTEKASSYIKGQPGTEVKLEVMREGAGKLLYFNITRELIKINPIKYEIKPGNIGYVRISEFNGNVHANMKKAIQEFKSKEVRGAIIDLRNNPGGLLNEVIEICRELIPKGPIVHIQQKGEISETYESTLEKAPFKLAVLVDGGSASASEIMAGAIQDSKTGILIGEKTYGKGTVQTIMPILGGGGIKLTIANYLTPSQFSLDGIGLTPDIEVKAAGANGTEYMPVNGGRSLKNNMIGLDVLGMQQRLERLGYKIEKLDGIFGPVTRAAVLNFQKDSNLAQDAVMEPEDIKDLQRKFEEEISKNDPQLDRAMAEMQKMLQ